MRRIIHTLAAISLMASTAGGLAQDKPSLADRRAITTYEKENFPPLQRKIRQAAGFDVPIEVDWNSLVMPGDAAYYARDEYFVKTIFEPIEVALAQITKDEMGKIALKENLKKISVRYSDDNVSATAYADRVKFDGGVLKVNFRPYYNTADVEDRTNTILKLLEASL